MNHNIFIKACELLKASGSSYEELISPFWSEVQDGVVLPTLGKVIPRMAPERYKGTWDQAMADAAAAGLTIPSREEAQYMYHHLDQINALLLFHYGDILPRNTCFWSRDEIGRLTAWYVNFDSGHTSNYIKHDDLYARPLAPFEKTLTYSRSCQR